MSLKINVSMITFSYTPPGEQMLIDFGTAACGTGTGYPLHMPLAALLQTVMCICPGSQV